ncbi:hypothetical protein DCAR_0102235 [Daucus carota subsp. sativus]|uniref:F-box domain-containing protein n=1 Tax=Daucus carota subsp. sativus TaxID=79200 RepID=A0AAF0W4X6_DAUCS|nr:hypothetical protein DCAR_0102235 [Daucus carota subsp. sativus]
MSLSRPLRNTKARITVEDEEDRISRLPDELIHQILEFVDTKLAIQTSLLSKRWKLIWKTLPFLKFRWVQQGSPTNTNNFTRQVLSRRNHQSQISSLELAFLPAGLFAKFVEYAISHHVQYLNVHLRRDHKPYKLSNFSSNSIQKLQLEMKFGDSISELDCWDLPALNTLHLTSYYNNHVENETNLFPALVNLRNLTWFFRQGLIKADCVINCPQLVNLNIYAYTYVTAFNNHSGNFILVAPKIRNISCVGLFPITFGLSQLESVNMKIRDRTDGRKIIPGSKLMNIYYRGFTYMFQSLGSTKILTLDLETIEV